VRIEHDDDMREDLTFLFGMGYNRTIMTGTREAVGIGSLEVLSVDMRDVPYNTIAERAVADDGTMTLVLKQDANRDDSVAVRLGKDWLSVHGAHDVRIAYHLDGNSFIVDSIVFDGVEYLPSDEWYEDDWLDNIAITRRYDSADGRESWLTIGEWDDYNVETKSMVCRFTLALDTKKPWSRFGPIVYVEIALAPKSG